MSNRTKKEIGIDINELLMTLALLDDVRDMQFFCTDLFTEKELYTFAMRWKAVRMLSADISYTTIAKETGMSSATIARLAKVLDRNVSGFRYVINSVIK
jgi:TrpR-related protein YerC/YecD